MREGVGPPTEAGLRPKPESGVELGYWHGKEGGAPEGSTSSSSCPRAPRRKKRFAGFPTAGRSHSPLPAAVTPRFSGLCAGAPGRAGARGRDVAGPANQRAHFWVARAPFCEGEYKWALGPDTRPVSSVLRWGSFSPLVGVSETIPRGSQLPEERRGVEPS